MMPVLPRRQAPPPSLLRPPRRGPRLFIVLPLMLLGMAVGMVLGLMLVPRVPPLPPAAPQASREAAPAPAAASATPQPAPQLPSTAGLETLRTTMAEEQAKLHEAIMARGAAEARLQGLNRAIAEAESRLASLQRETSQARREAARPPRAEAPQPATANAPSPAAAGAGPKVVVHYRAGSATAAETAANLASVLRDGGMEPLEPRAAPAVPGQRVVRYFHSGDAAAAARLAGRLGRGWAIQDFRTYEPSPPPQTLEVWLPDR